MLLTLIAMQGVWLAWREHQQRKTARRRLVPTGAGSSQPAVPTPPFWATLLARYRREMAGSRHRHARTRKAIDRINMAAERRLRGTVRRA